MKNKSGVFRFEYNFFLGEDALFPHTKTTVLANATGFSRQHYIETKRRNWTSRIDSWFSSKLRKEPYRLSQPKLLRSRL